MEVLVLLTVLLCVMLLQLDKTYTGVQTMGAETVGHSCFIIVDVYAKYSTRRKVPQHFCL